MLGNEEDFTACLGFEVEGLDPHITNIEAEAFKKMIQKAVAEYKNFKVVATTLRKVITATKNDWSAICWMDGKFYESRQYPALEILDRVGGGDSFASGLIYGLMKTGDPQKAVDYGAAHGALAMTTPGDTSMATVKGSREGHGRRKRPGAKVSGESEQKATKIAKLHLLPLFKPAIVRCAPIRRRSWTLPGAEACGYNSFLLFVIPSLSRNLSVTTLRSVWNIPRDNKVNLGKTP